MVNRVDFKGSFDYPSLPPEKESEKKSTLHLNLPVKSHPRPLDTRRVQAVDLKKFREMSTAPEWWVLALSIVLITIPYFIIWGMRASSLTKAEAELKDFAIKDTNTKIQQLDRAIAKADDSEKWRYRLEKGYQLLLTGNEDDVAVAQKELREAENSHSSPELSFLKAQAYGIQNRWKEAHDAYQQALTLTGKTGQDALKHFPHTPHGFLHLIMSNHSEAVAKQFLETYLYLTSKEGAKKIPPGGSEDLSKLLIMCSELITKYPDQLPRFLAILKDDPAQLHALSKLSAQLDNDTFSYLVEKYVANPKSKDNLTTSFLQSLVADTPTSKTYLRKFKELLNIERERNLVLLPLFNPNVKRLTSSVFTAVAKNIEFSKKIDPHIWQDEKGFHWLSKNILEAVTAELFAVAGSNQNALIVLLHEGKKFSDPKLYDETLLKMVSDFQKDPETTRFTPALLSLIEAQNFTLARKLASLKYPDLKKRLLELVENHEVALVKVLLELPENEKLTQLLLSKASIKTLPIIISLLQLNKDFDDHPLVELAIREGPLKEPPFSRELQALFKLQAQRETQLSETAISIMHKPSNIRSLQEKQFLMFIAAERFSLARDYMNASKDPSEAHFWKNLSIFFPDPQSTPQEQQRKISILQSLRDLQLSIKERAIPSFEVNFPTKALESIERMAMLMAQHGKADFHNWVSMIQYSLKHNPEALLKKISSPSWQTVEKSLESLKGTSEALDALLKDLPEDIKHIEDAIQGQLKFIASRQAGFDTSEKLLSRLLLTLGGTINVPIIHLIRKTSLIKNSDRYEDVHRKRILDLLEQQHTVSDRLECVHAPPEESRQQALVKSMMNGEAERNHAQAAVLQALFTPLRQSQAGSCFGTAIAIQLDSSVQGLKQSLEDYISLVHNGYLTRINKNGAGFQHPMSFDAKTYGELFAKDNFLTRVREFTIASMGASRALLTAFSTFTPRRREIFSVRMEEFTNKLTSEEQKAFSSSKLSKIALKVGKNALVRYLGYARSPTGKVGAWALADRTSGDHAISKEQLRIFFRNSIKKEIEALNLNEKDHLELAERLKRNFEAYIETDKFFEDLFGANAVNIPSTFVAKELPHTPWTVFDGGFAVNVIKQYHSSGDVQITEWPKYGHSLKAICNYVMQLPEHVKAEARANPHLLRPLGYSLHAMNLKIGQLLLKIENAGGPETFIAGIRKANRELMLTKLNAESPKAQAESASIQKTLIAKFLQAYSQESVELEAAIRHALKQHRPETLQELCLLLMRAAVLTIGKADSREQAKTILIQAIRNIDQLKGKVQEVNAVDTNWSEPEAIIFGIDVDGACDASFNSTGNEIPEPFTSWSSYEFNSKV